MMLTHGTKIRRHLRSARVAALTPEERREELRAAAARYAEEPARSEEAGADPAGPAGPSTHDSEPDSRAF